MAKVVWSVGLGAACAACGRIAMRPYKGRFLRVRSYNNVSTGAAMWLVMDGGTIGAVNGVGVYRDAGVWPG